jgi:hypothetical protein
MSNSRALPSSSSVSLLTPLCLYNAADALPGVAVISVPSGPGNILTNEPRLARAVAASSLSHRMLKLNRRSSHRSITTWALATTLTAATTLTCSVTAICSTITTRRWRLCRSRKASSRYCLTRTDAGPPEDEQCDSAGQPMKRANMGHLASRAVLIHEARKSRKTWYGPSRRA